MANLPCPWGQSVVDLSRERLTSNQKLWLVMKVIEKKLRPIEIEERFNISTKTISKWKITYRNGILPQKTEKTRPKVVDEEGFAKLTTIIRTDPNISESVCPQRVD